ncbi:MAG: helix-turn-helix transcriptional regulator [Oscillospiraceae bacterium]|nr:helix-turn-helix transcriptional regulator [Oscillospiraceae bacterium]
MTSIISYNKLWKVLIDKGMNKKDLKLASGISTTAIAKLGKGENLNTDTLLKVCDVLNCDISDICEVVRMNDGLE